MKDYYQILGISKSASPADIKAAYRKKAMEHHPDRNPNDNNAEARFKEVNEAYDVLKDPNKKAIYDQGGNPNHAGGGFGGFEEGFSGFSEGFDGFENIFGGMFDDLFTGGRGSRSSQNKRGNDLLYNLNITLEEAFSGANKTISINSFCKCTSCAGSGAKGAKQFDTCKECNGKGKVRKKVAFFSLEQLCPKCSGSGKTIKNPCPTCSGQGRLKRSRKLEVAIPAGINHGMRIRMPGEGEAGLTGAEAGDLYVAIHVLPHKTFVRKGNYLNLSITIPMTLAALGGYITIKTIDNKELEVAIPKGIQNNQKLRVKNQGFADLNSHHRSDLLIEVTVETPSSLSAEQIRVLQTMFPVAENKKYKINT
ncbi:Chaperone protein DnaJ [Candidatus Hepatincola sp. Pdp]